MFYKRLFYQALFTLLLACHPGFIKQKESFSHRKVNAEKPSDAAAKIIHPYKRHIDSITEKVIAFSLDPLTREKEQSTLGNFVCDAIKWKGESFFAGDKIDVVIVNRGGLRNNLPKGEIKVLNIFELMPFENEMVLLAIKGQKLLDGLKTIVDKKHAYWGLRLILKNEMVTESSVNGRLIDMEKTYFILTSDYVANGGDSFNFLSHPIERKNCSIKIRDAIIDYCMHLTKNEKQIIPYLDERLIISK